MICTENNTTIGALEKRLGYPNGALSAVSLSPKRALQVSEYFNIPIEYLLSGDEKDKNKVKAPAFQASSAVEYYQQREQLLRTITEEQQELIELSLRMDAVKESLEVHKAKYDALVAEDFLYE